MKNLCWLMLFFGFLNTASAQWEFIGGQARDVGVGADGTAWVIGWNRTGNDYPIAKWNGNFWEEIPGAAVRIDVGPNGRSWVVNSNGSIYRYNGTFWDNIGGQARDVGIGADGTVWVIGWSARPGGFNIARWNGNFWEEIPGGGVRIDVDPNGRAWIVNDAGNIFRYNGSTWDGLPGQGRDISIGADGTPWLVGWTATPGGYFIYQWNGSSWLDVQGGATNISAGRGVVWGVNDAGVIFRQNIPNRLTNFPSGGDIRTTNINAPSPIDFNKGVYVIKSAIGGKNLDVMRGNNANGVGLHLWDANEGDAQLFTIEPSNEVGYYYIRTKWGRAVDVAGFNPSPGASLNTYDLHGGDNQKWMFYDIGDGYYKIKSKYGTYLDVQNGNSASGTPIWMYSNNSSDAQKWKLISTTIEIPYNTWIEPFMNSLRRINIYFNNFTPNRNEFNNSGERAFIKPNSSVISMANKNGTIHSSTFNLDIIENGLNNACKNYLSNVEIDKGKPKPYSMRGVQISMHLPIKGRIVSNCYNNVCCNNPFCNAGCKDEDIIGSIQLNTIVEKINGKISYRLMDVYVNGVRSSDTSIGGSAMTQYSKQLANELYGFFNVNAETRRVIEDLLSSKIMNKNYRQISFSVNNSLILSYQ